MSFLLSHSTLARLCERNLFDVPEDEMVFFGLRGCQPMSGAQGHAFKKQHEMRTIAVDYLHPRCTIGQWLPSEKKLAVFQGSTSPHHSYIAQNLPNQGEGTNELMLGLYRDYRKGHHLAGKPTGHPAFRQTKGRPIRRTANDAVYGNDDRVEFEIPFDNLHAGWAKGGESAGYASAGCQVVVGYPGCPKRGGDSSDVGPWGAFRKNAYDLPQDRFNYILLSGLEAETVANAGSAKLETRARFGSKGPLVKKLQQALAKQSFYEGATDEDFGERTIRAVLAFQTANFGEDADDGIVDAMTAGVLGVAWPDK